MKDIVGVRFRKLGKVYFFDPQYLICKKNEYVIVATDEGEEIAEVVLPNRKMEEEKLHQPLKRVLRIANYRDLKHYKECEELEKDAFNYCEKKIKELNLKMKLTNVECKFDNTKLTFYFTADGRVD